MWGAVINFFNTPVPSTELHVGNGQAAGASS
jgi:hypothetical protein